MLLGTNWVETHEDAIEIVEGDTAPNETPPTGSLNTGIGVVLPGHYIVEAIEQPKLRGRREERLKQKTDRSYRPSAASPSKPKKPAEPARLPMPEGDEKHKERFTALFDEVVGKPKRGD